MTIASSSTRISFTYPRVSSAHTLPETAVMAATRTFSGRLYCTERALWKLNWFLRDFGYDTDLLGQDQVDDKAVRNLQGVVRTSLITFNGRSYQNLDGFAPAGEWEELSHWPIDRRTSDDLQPHTD